MKKKNTHCTQPKGRVRKSISEVKTNSSLPPSSPILINTKDTLSSLRKLSSLMTQVEAKEPVPQFRGRDAPTSLAIPFLGFTLADSKESLILRDTFRGLFGDKHYTFRLSTALNMSSSGGGIVNSTISNSTLASHADFTSLTTVFNEFFVEKFQTHWMPNSRYNYPLTGTSAASVANLPIGKGDLQHGQAAYTSLTLMTDNHAFQYHNSGDPFSDSWINSEREADTTLASLTAPTQSWCTVNNVSNYQGTLQYISQAAPPGLPTSQVLGTFVVHWLVKFRVRT